jgi:NDP-sugar pyrophosphorylase family protein
MNEDLTTLKRIGIGSKELAKMFGFKTVKYWYDSPRKKEYTAAAASIVRSTAQYLLNKNEI